MEKKREKEVREERMERNTERQRKTDRIEGVRHTFFCLQLIPGLSLTI